MIKSLLTFLVAISHSSTGNHILSKAVLAVCLAAGQSNSKTFIYHIGKIKRLLCVCLPLLSWGREQTTSYLWSCTYHWLYLVFSSVAWGLLLYGSFLLLLLLISSLWWATPTPLQGKFMIIFMPKLLLLESFPGLPCFIFMEQLYLCAQCKIISFKSPHSSLKAVYLFQIFSNWKFYACYQRRFSEQQTLTGLQFYKC